MKKKTIKKDEGKPYASPKIMKSLEETCIIGPDLMQRNGIWDIVSFISMINTRIDKIANNDAEFLFLKNWAASCLLKVGTNKEKK